VSRIEEEVLIKKYVKAALLTFLIVAAPCFTALMINEEN
jgi:hypothetical protein